jgi:hypothetical protein
MEGKNRFRVWAFLFLADLTQIDTQISRKFFYAKSARHENV